jgi:arginine decarboxylase
MPSYHEYLRPYLAADGRLNDFLRVRNGRIIFADTLDLLELAHQYGTPLEVSFCPLITRRVRAMHTYFAAARAQTGYRGGFVYAYATKANFAAEVVQTALAAGAHYETSSAFDVRIAQTLWQRGILPSERFVFCNGSKEQPYIDAILELRQAGFTNVVPILDDPAEFEALVGCSEPLLLGVRERKDPGDLAEGITYGYDRFGMLPSELERLAVRVAQTHHRIILYHAMVGSQLEDPAHWIGEVIESLEGYARLRAHAPAMDYFNFGGGMPTGAYRLDFAFDYAAFARQVFQAVGARCDVQGIPHPHLVGEFGRYTVADHGVHIFRVGRIKQGHPGMPPWYLVDGSLMVALPDILIVKGQSFIVLPLTHLDAEAGPVMLGGRRTCDSDDFYPRPGAPPLVLPLVGVDRDRHGEAVAPVDRPTLSIAANAAPLLIAFFGTGAYQAMLAGEGGAHHCLAPEAPKLIVEEQDGALRTRVIGEQSWADVLGELGYR